MDFCCQDTGTTGTEGIICDKVSAQEVWWASYRMCIHSVCKTILPILCYGSEVWGYQTYDVIEKVQIQFCKYVLGLSVTATAVAVLGECGRFPVYNTCVSRCVKYWLHIVGMTNERYPKVMYNILKHLNFNLFTICIDITKTHFNIIQIQVHIARCCLAYKVVFRQHLHNNIQYIYICDGVCTTCAVQMYVYLILQFNVCGVYVMCCIQYL